MLIAQLTDFHVPPPGGHACGGIDTVPGLAAVIADLAALRPAPDLVLMTGDLADKGDDGACATIARLLEPLAMPVRMIPGNHDDRDSLRRAFAGRGWVPAGGTHLHHVVEDGPVRVVMLDTVIPGRTEGVMDGERLAWLAARLAEAPDRPTVVAMHHPPFASGMPDIDALGCGGGEALGRLIESHGRVAAVLCGHVHCAVFTRWAGTRAIIAPSTARQFDIDLAGLGRPVWCGEPPAYLLHLWREDTGLVSHVRTVTV